VATQTFYLSSEPADTDPSITGWWDDADSTGVSALRFAPAGDNTGHTATASAGGNDVLLHRWVSPEITTAGTLEASGVVADLISAIRSDAGGTETSWGIRVIDSDGDDRGTFLAATSGGSEWEQSLTGKAEDTPDFVASSVDVEPGDRVVIEYGFRPTDSGTEGEVRTGGTGGTDLADGDTGSDATTRPGSVTFTGADSSDLWDGATDPDPGEPADLMVIATTSAGSDTETTIEVDTPSGLQDGDVLLGVHFYTYNATQDHGPASGFTEDYFDDSISGSDDTSPVLVIYSREVTDAGSEPGSYTFDAASDGNNVIFLVAVRGADASDLYADGLEAEGTPNATGHELPARTLSEDGSLYLGFFGSQAYTEDADTNWAAPPEMDEAGQFSEIFNNGLVAYEVRGSGEVGAREATVSSSESAGKVGSLALRAGTGSGEPPPDTAAERYGWGEPLPASDEFDYTGPPDPAKWGVYDGEGHDGNGVRDPDQVTVADGYLRIEGTEDGASGGLAASFNQQYGRWECRARFESLASGGESYHPVLIVWPESEEWPEDGEYDWLEIEDVDTDQIQAYLHYPHPPGPIEQEYVTGPDGIDFTEWHNFAFEWVEGSLRGFLDGEEWFSLDGSMTSSNGRRLDSMPSGHLTIQLDNFTGSSGLQPATFDVEWARVYSTDDSSEVRSASGAAPAELGATGTGSKAADTAGAASAVLGASGTASRTATASGTARMRLAAEGSGRAERTGTGTAPAALTAAGAGGKTADTAGDAAVRLGTSGTATGVPINARAGTAAAALDASGSGRKVASASGTARMGLAGSGTGVKDAAGTGTVPALALGEAADSDRTADGTGQAPPARLATAGSTDGRTADRVSGTVPAYLSADGTGTRETDTHGALSALLRAAGISAGLRAAEGSAGPLALTAAGTGTRTATASGTARMRLTAAGIASGSGGVAIRYGTADPLGLAATGTGRKVATTTGRVSGLALAAGAAPLRPGRGSVTSGARSPVSVSAGDRPVSITERGSGLRVRAANA